MNDLKHILPLMIPIIAIVMGIGIGMLAIYLDYRKKRDLLELHHKERLAAIERGMELPPLPAALLQSERVVRHAVPGDYLRRGLLWLGVGLAIAALLGTNYSIERATWGLIPAAVGLAYLIFFAADARARQAGGEGLVPRLDPLDPADKRCP
jgi:Domain of unknown function (DUF6249)